jgi:glycosyltransferase involved in cell wall biosynthesis
MPKITSNTIVKNGMPFIGKILEQVEPFVDEMIITVSEKSTDGTVLEIETLRQKHPDKVFVDTENVVSPKYLTDVRNNQVKKSHGDWILILDDDDYWTPDQLQFCISELDKDPSVLCYAVNPYQLIDFENHDTSWSKKYFSKFLRRDGLRFKYPWPRELPIDSNGVNLYWKDNPAVKKLPYRLYHLSYLKSGSFRKEEWGKKYEDKVGLSSKLPQKVVI